VHEELARNRFVDICLTSYQKGDIITRSDRIEARCLTIDFERRVAGEGLSSSQSEKVAIQTRLGISNAISGPMIFGHSSPPTKMPSLEARSQTSTTTVS
jgi:hypothetical protein